MRSSNCIDFRDVGTLTGHVERFLETQSEARINEIKEMVVKSMDEISRSLAEAAAELAALDARRAGLVTRITELQQEKAALLPTPEMPLQSDRLPSVANQSSQESKIALFRRLFRGREDVYPKRFESVKTGKKGYQPVCGNEWVEGICEKPRIRCEDCQHRQFLPITDQVVKNHLLGMDPQDRPGRDFTMGVYPMLLDETCWFLAADFDKVSWQTDAGAFQRVLQNSPRRPRD